MSRDEDVDVEDVEWYLTVPYSSWCFSALSLSASPCFSAVWRDEEDVERYLTDSLLAIIVGDSQH